MKKQVVMSLILVVVLLLSNVSFSESYQSDASSQSVLFLDGITWDTSAKDADTVMQANKIKRSGMYDIWQELPFEDKDNGGLIYNHPYEKGVVFGSTAYMMNLMYTADGKLYYISVSYSSRQEPTSFDMVYACLTHTYGKENKVGYYDWKGKYRNQEAYFWFLSDGVIILKSSTEEGSMVSAKQNNEFVISIYKDVPTTSYVVFD